MADESGYRSVVRLIEYHGDISWLEKTLAASRIPIQGALNLPKGCYIKSGIVSWQPDEITERQVENSDNEDTQAIRVAPIVDQAKKQTVPFKRPGE